MSNDLELTDLHKLILRNAEKIRQLYDRIKTTFKERDDSPKKYEEWKRACAEFHSSYDALAFPGSWDAIGRIDTGDPAAMEAAISYLECRPYFHRSGYTFQIILKRVKRAKLSGDQNLRLQKVIEKRDDWRRNLPDRLRAQAEQGDRVAQRKLGKLYSLGYKYNTDFKRNTAEAIKQFRAAADQGDVRAQRELASSYAYGWGVPQNWGESYFWYCLAARCGGGNFTKIYEVYRQKAADTLSPEQKAAIDKRVEEWNPAPTTPTGE